MYIQARLEVQIRADLLSSRPFRLLDNQTERPFSFLWVMIQGSAAWLCFQKIIYLTLHWNRLQIITLSPQHLFFLDARNWGIALETEHSVFFSFLSPNGPFTLQTWQSCLWFSFFKSAYWNIISFFCFLLRTTLETYRCGTHRCRKN